MSRVRIKKEQEKDQMGKSSKPISFSGKLVITPLDFPWHLGSIFGEKKKKKNKKKGKK